MTTSLKKQIYNYDYIMKLKNDFLTIPNNYIETYNKCNLNINNSNNLNKIKLNFESMIKIKTQNNYSNIDKIKMTILTDLNKLTNENKNKIIKYLNENISNKELLYYFTENLFISTINEKTFVKLYIDFIIFFIKKNNFYITNNINFYKIFINIIQNKFEYLFIDNNLDLLISYQSSNIEKYYKEKNHNISNILLIGNLYINDLLNKDIINIIINKLLDKHELKIEILLNLLKVINNKLNNKQLINDINIKINELNNLRLKYILEDIIENGTVQIEIKEKPTCVSVVDKSNKLNNLINEYISHKNINYSTEYLDEFIGNYKEIYDDFILILFELDDIEKINLISDLFIQLNNKYKFNIEDVITSIKNINIEDIILDIPLVKNYYNLFISLLYKNKIINKINYNNLNIYN